MECPKCQAENPDSATFCSTCGAKLEALEAQASPPAEKKKRGRRKTLVIVAGIAVILCIVVAIIASLSGGGGDEATPTAARVGEVEQPTEPAPTGEAQPEATEPPADTPAPAATDTPSPTNTPVPTESPLPPTATPNPDLKQPGTYIVGTDIEPGLYKGEAGSGLFGSCYWARLKDLLGTLDSVIANDNSVGQFYVEVREGDYAFETACEVELLRSLPEPPAEFPSSISVGTYLVGTDIEPGLYTGEAGSDFAESCYWARLKDLSGTLDGVTANDNSIGQFYVQVREADYALTTACELDLLRSLPEPPAEFPQSIPAGTYLVGIDIQAGTYKGQAGTDFTESCYWARLKDALGELDSVLANDNATGQFYVEVRKSDFALSTACELERVAD